MSYSDLTHDTKKMYLDQNASFFTFMVTLFLRRFVSLKGILNLKMEAL